jgi:hypothetical protein
MLLSPLLSNFAAEYVIKKVRKSGLTEIKKDTSSCGL